jgi:hypothetical protein
MANFLSMIDSTLASLTKSLYSDGSISRTDMIAILNSVKNESDGVVDSNDMSDLKTIVGNAKTLKMADYVYVLTCDIVNGSTANAKYLGSTLGNLSVGSSNTVLGKLVNKWFYGTDLPTTSYTYSTTTAGTLYSTSGPSHLDEKQGVLGDCYLISALGSVADSCSTAIKNMIIANGDGTWTVRFYSNGKADYVTVNGRLPVSSSGTFVYEGYGAKATSSTNVLWLALVEKAYVQWNETGKTLQGNYLNSYTAIAGGWTGTVYQQVLGSATTYCKYLSASGAQAALISVLSSKQAVTIATVSSPNYSTTGLYGNHAYNVLSYNSTTGLFTLYNPWGSNQPKQLTWAQLLANCTAFASSVASKTTSAVTTTVAASISVKSGMDFWAVPANAASSNNGNAAVAVSEYISSDETSNASAGWEESSLLNNGMTSSTANRSSLDATFGDFGEASRDAFTEIDALIDSLAQHLAQWDLLSV